MIDPEKEIGDEVGFAIEKKGTARRSKQKDLEMVPVNRKLKTYRVTASELRNLANDNTVAKGAFSTGCALVTFALGIWSGILIEGTPSAFAVSLAWFLVPICFILSGVCFAV